MSKVLVDRELLERIAANRDASPVIGDLQERLRAVLAQPAEAEGVEVVAYVGRQARMTTDGWENGEEYVVFADQASDADKRYDVPLMTVTQHLAALSAVTVERDRLQAALDDPDYPPKHSRRLIAQLRAEVEALREVVKFACVTLAVTAKSESLTEAERRSLLSEVRRCDAAMAAKEA